MDPMPTQLTFTFRDRLLYHRSSNTSLPPSMLAFLESPADVNPVKALGCAGRRVCREDGRPDGPGADSASRGLGPGPGAFPAGSPSACVRGQHPPRPPHQVLPVPALVPLRPGGSRVYMLWVSVYDLVCGGLGWLLCPVGCAAVGGETFLALVSSCSWLCVSPLPFAIRPGSSGSAAPALLLGCPKLTACPASPMPLHSFMALAVGLTKKCAIGSTCKGQPVCPSCECLLCR